MFDHFSTNNIYRAPSALVVAARARKTEKQLRLEYDLERARRLAAQEKDRCAESRRSWFSLDMQWMKEKVITRAAAEQQPRLVESQSAERPC